MGVILDLRIRGGNNGKCVGESICGCVGRISSVTWRWSCGIEEAWYLKEEL